MSPERSEPVSDPAELTKLKAHILEQWRLLPPEAAAAVMVEQLRDSLDSGPILPPETDPRLRSFVAVSVCRADLKECFDEEEVAQFDDRDMKQLADTMGDWYRDESYYHDLEMVGRIILSEKAKKK